MANRPYEHKAHWFYLAPITIAIFIVVQIALSTDFNVHPDEAVHLDAMCYFESHSWPPSLNHDGLLYSPDGWSRVYNGELVYLIYGRAGTWIRPLAEAIQNTYATPPLTEPQPYHVLLPMIFSPPHCATLYQIYRLLNVLLLIVTLVSVFLGGRRNVLVTVVGLTMLCLPQVLYIYAYANSDAWGLSASIFLFVFLLTTKAEIGSNRYGIMLGVIIGLLILSKETFWLSMSWAVALIGTKYIQRRKYVGYSPSLKRLGGFFGVVALTVLLVIAPLKIVYPLSQGNWRVRTEQMREARSWLDFQPSAPTNSGYRLASKGESIDVITSNPTWFEASIKSFYGYFGHMVVMLPNWVYLTALTIGMLNITLSAGVAMFQWPLLNPNTKALMVVAPLCILLSIAASLYNSWTYDFQPQGRYLFSSVIPLAMLLAGTVEVENRWCIRFRAVSWLAGFTLCMYVLANFAL
jgi:hypothetical protein